MGLIVCYFKIACSVNRWKKSCTNACNLPLSLWILRLFLQIVSMGLQTTLLIVLFGTCATAGNDVRLARLHKCLSIFWLALEIDCQQTRCGNDWAQAPIVACLARDRYRMNVYSCKRLIERAYTYVHILIASACTQVQHKLSRQQIRVRRSH